MSANGTNNVLTSNFIKTMENVNDAITPFIPFFTLISGLTAEIVRAYENVQYNKKTCGVLVNRVEAAETAVKGLIRLKEENIQNFRNKTYFDSFERFVICLEKIKDFF